MRVYCEPTARNLLRRPLIFGVPLFGLIGLASLVLGMSVALGGVRYGDLISLAVGASGYVILRVTSQFAKTGWEESLIWPIERRVRIKNPNGRSEFLETPFDIQPPDTLDERELIASKEALLERIVSLNENERYTIVCEMSDKGAEGYEIGCSGRFSLAGKLDFSEITRGIYTGQEQVYSLYQIPVQTDPLFLFSILKRIDVPVTVVVTVRGVSFQSVKRQIEISRRNNARGDSVISDIDAEVAFEDSSAVLQGLSRGDETLVEISLILISPSKLDLDHSMFCHEKRADLAVCATLGLRHRLHRTHLVRAVTACDLIPNLNDPVEPGASILTTVRKKPLYFSPNDSRLEALHWLVVGASGSGKSFFTGLVLKRMIEARVPMSVLFIDHNRSFRRLVRAFGQGYEEPKKLNELQASTACVFSHLNSVGGMAGIELSDLDQNDKKMGIQTILGQLEAFLRSRDSTHPVYVVLDECWNFMRDEPLLVQRAFREFRKLNGAAIAVTQSLSDFLTDQSGQSIFQNAPIRILLRQGEDLEQYQGILGLNSVELTKVRSLRQKKGVFSECLIKTPFLSRFGRLYPTDVEHALLRTDNLREELIAEIRKNQLLERSQRCVSPS